MVQVRGHLPEKIHLVDRPLAKVSLPVPGLVELDHLPHPHGPALAGEVEPGLPRGDFIFSHFSVFIGPRYTWGLGLLNLKV